MKKLICVALCCVNCLAFADQVEPYNGAGAYINANAGLATQQNLPTGGFTFNANAGYNFNRGFALEGGYTNIASSQFGSTLTNNIFDIAAKGTIPLSSVFSLYGRLGGGLQYMSWGGTAVNAPSWYANERSGVNFVGLASIGGSFNLSRHFDLRLEDTMFVPMGGGNPNTGQVNTILGGVQYNF